MPEAAVSIRLRMVEREPQQPGPDTAPDRPSPVRLVLLSFLMLFVELGLIRWSGAYILYLSFFTNFVLLASFLGVGVGFLRARAERDLFRHLPGLLAALVLFLAVFPVQGGRVAGRLQFVGGFGWPALPKWLSLAVVFLLAFLIMAAIAEGVGRLFVRFQPLEAYRWDILGSILGIVAFSALSFLQASPFVWGVIAAAIYLVVAARRQASQLVPLSVAVVVLGILSFSPNTHWSPYYRVTARPAADDGSVAISVNGRPHQRIMPLAVMEETQTFRFDPYRHAPGNPLTDVLIIGAGSGNDVTIALARGAAHVDAVEIDPLLYRLGRDRHPDRPYQDPRVTVHIEDGRSFLHDTEQRYDLVLYAIPDSLTVLAGQSSLRLESYLLTREAMQEVRDHLKPDGVISMYHYYLPVVVDRYADALTRVYGEPPVPRARAGCGTAPANRADGEHAARGSCLRPALVAARAAPRARHRRSSVRLPGRARDPGVLSRDVARDRARFVRRRATVCRPVRTDAPIRRPLLHGGGVPAARDIERRPVRSALRHDLVRERPRVRGDPGVGVSGDRGRTPVSGSGIRRCSTCRCSLR